MLNANTISLAARGLRNYLASNLSLVENQIFIGHPTIAFKDTEDDDSKQYLNLFIYRIAHGAYPADGTKDDPFYVRLYCLITALGIACGVYVMFWSFGPAILLLFFKEKRRFELRQDRRQAVDPAPEIRELLDTPEN